MTKTARLVMRGSTFYFRMAVPCDLVAVFGRREVKRSLRTSDRTLATIRCRALSNNVDYLCRDLRNMLESQNNAVDETVRAFFQHELDTGVDFAEVFAPESLTGHYRSDPRFLATDGDAISAHRTTHALDREVVMPACIPDVLTNAPLADVFLADTSFEDLAKGIAPD